MPVISQGSILDRVKEARRLVSGCFLRVRATVVLQAAQFLNHPRALAVWKQFSDGPKLVIPTPDTDPVPRQVMRVRGGLERFNSRRKRGVQSRTLASL